MPNIGYGSFKVPQEVVKEKVLAALNNGYRHIDTAISYGNEEGVGDAIKEFLEKNPEITREDLFLTSKIPLRLFYKEMKERGGKVKSKKG